MNFINTIVLVAVSIVCLPSLTTAQVEATNIEVLQSQNEVQTSTETRTRITKSLTPATTVQPLQQKLISPQPPVLATPKSLDISIVTQRGGKASVRLLSTSALFPITSIEIVPIRNEILMEDVARGGLKISTKAFGNSFKLEAQGRLGGKICPQVSAENPHLEVKEGKVEIKKNPDPDCNNPELVTRNTLPAICPHMRSQIQVTNPSMVMLDNPVGNPDNDAYLTSLDSINFPSPVEMYGLPVEKSFDGKNVIQLIKAETEFDWEDKGIVIGYHAATQKLLTEHEGGVYSNFHYYVVPCDKELDNQYDLFLQGVVSAMKLPPQTALTAEGLLSSVARGEPGSIARAASTLMRCGHNLDGCTPEENAGLEAMQFLLHYASDSLSPTITNHSLLPGPFWTEKDEPWGGKLKTGTTYQQCEWLDTAYQAPRQSVTYRDLSIFDLDQLMPKEDPCIAVLVLEGDGFSKIHRDDVGLGSIGYIREIDMEEDFVGYFTVPVQKLYDGKTLRVTNYSKDMTLEFAFKP